MDLKAEATKLIGEGSIRQAIALILEKIPDNHDISSADGFIIIIFNPFVITPLKLIINIHISRL